MNTSSGRHTSSASNRKYLLILLLGGSLLFFPFLGSVHLFDWDEINFAESAREMLVTGNYTQVQINYKPFWEKPPLYFWLQALSMKIFSVNEYAARFPNALLGVITLLTFYFIGRKLYDEKFGFIWALCYAGSFLPFLYFKSGIIDPWFNYFIFLSVYFFAKGLANNKDSTAQKINITRTFILSGLFAGLAILTKGPVAFLILVLTIGIYIVFKKFKITLQLKNIVFYLLTVLAVSFLWFGFETISHGPWFLKEFITYQIRLFSTPDAGHAQPFYYHFLVVAVGCFPISVFAAGKLFTKRSGEENEFSLWMKILFWVVMILFSIVTTKIVHYSSLSYFPVSFLAALYIKKIYEGGFRISRVMFVLLIFFGVIFSALLTALPLVFMFKESIYQYIKDPFAVDCLKTGVVWGGYEFLTGIIYFAALVTAFIMLHRKKIQTGIYFLFGSTAIAVFIFLATAAPKIEAYSQAPAIEFFERYAGSDVYMTTVGYKSYAQYFYFKVPPGQNPDSKDQGWLLSGNIDKPVYFVVKSTAKKEIEKYPGIKFLEQKGGFLLYVREK